MISLWESLDPSSIQRCNHVHCAHQVIIARTLCTESDLWKHNNSDWALQSEDGYRILTGWWFGTCFICPYILGVIIPTDFHIFQRGGSITNQLKMDRIYRPVRLRFGPGYIHLWKIRKLLQKHQKFLKFELRTEYNFS